MIYVGLPTYDGRMYTAALSAYVQPSAKYITNKPPLRIDFSDTSALTANFNTLFCNALNARNIEGFTHFAMLHNDVLVKAGWLDILMDEMIATEADMISAVVPIKDERGITSTALDIEGGDPTRPKRLTLHEIFHKYPETFTDPNLLLNTGCMLIDMRKPWVEQVAFKFTDWIEKDENGLFRAKFIPEDWDFSRQAKKLGAKIFATRKVKVSHAGRKSYTNHSDWGTVKE